MGNIFGEFCNCDDRDNYIEMNMRRRYNVERINPRDLDFLSVPEILDEDLYTINELP